MEGHSVRISHKYYMEVHQIEILSKVHWMSAVGLMVGRSGLVYVVLVLVPHGKGA